MLHGRLEGRGTPNRVNCVLSFLYETECDPGLDSEPRGKRERCRPDRRRADDEGRRHYRAAVDDCWVCGYEYDAGGRAGWLAGWSLKLLWGKRAV